MSDGKITNLQFKPAECFKLFDQSFNRVKYFACIADNIDTDKLPDDWAIKGNSSGMLYCMKQPSEDEKVWLVDGFQYYLRRFLVRDSIESFALCLDEICFMLLLLNEKKRKIMAGQSLYDTLKDEEKQFLENFRSKGLSIKDGKIGLLKEGFNLELSDSSKKIIKGLKDIRDCLTHRNGIASVRDGFAARGKKIRFDWLTLEFFVFDKKTKAELPLRIGELYELEEGGDIRLKIKEHAKILNIGEFLSFSSLEVYEITQSLQWIGREYLKQIGGKYGT